LRGAFALAILSLLLAPASSSAYVRTRSPDNKFALAWADPSIVMNLRTSGPQVVSLEDFEAAATRAAATWSAPGLASSIDFKIVPSADVPAGTHADDVNVISFRTTGWDEPMYPGSALALTTVWSRAAVIVDADTEINAANPDDKWALLPDDPMLASMAQEVDLQNALTHEMGHVLGLDHPCFLGDPPKTPRFDDKGAPVLSCSDPALPAIVKSETMFPSSQPGGISERVLSVEEIDALHDIYPERGPVDPMLGARPAGCRVASGGDGAAAALALGAAALAAARRRRRS
jgi:MYXO-CTERM domain-containing protein